jgi:protein-S-isoprenylcysteine O-methyltransferase Ste14
MTSQTRTSFFDIRLIIALLLGIYGLVLTILGLFFVSDEELRKSADVNINLWTGIAMLVVGALFLLWAWLRPLRVPVPEPPAESAAD